MPKIMGQSAGETLFIYFFIYYIFLFIYLFVCLFVYLFIYLFICFDWREKPFTFSFKNSSERLLFGTEHNSNSIEHIH